jgi:Brp/Blh family beta-carotene 15,15'-monooxygenase
MNKNFNIIITAFVIWISLYTNSQIELFASGIFVLSLGLMHGANDINLLQELLKKNKTKKWQLITVYVGLGALIFTLAFSWRILGLIVFMLFSSYHFGEQHLHSRLLNSKNKTWDYTLYGLVIFSMLFSTHQADAQYLIFHMTGWNISHIPLNTITIALLATLIISWVFQLRYFKKGIFEELFYLLMFYVVFFNTELSLSFAVYFVIWHALPSIKDQILIEGQSLGYKSALRYFKQSYRYWLVSVFGIFLMAKGYDYMGTGLFPILFAALVAITFPHIILITGLFQKMGQSTSAKAER